LALIAAVLFFVCGYGAVSARALGRLPFQVLLNADGSGRIFMNNGTIPSWEICRADRTGCTAFATGSFSTGNAPPGSVFWAGGELITPLWKGNVRNVVAPSVRGRVRGNEVVTPVAGQWEGGWETDYDGLSFSICTTAAGADCLQINHEGREESCGTNGATFIDPAFAGGYLRVVDRRYGDGTLSVGVGHPPYYPIPKIQPKAIVSTAAFKIAPATGPPKVQCGPPPVFTAAIADDGSAEVTCRLLACRAVLLARGPGGTARLERKLRPAPYSGVSPTLPNGQPRTEPGTTTLRLAPSALERLEGHPIRLEVRLNGTTFAHRTIRLGALPLVAAYPNQHY
jgi:hypothetical protein